jgi:DNA invertase Pin-like site-specific DNA recombinase
MLRIGYVRLRDAQSSEDTATLKAMGCHVVRAEEPGGRGDEPPVLGSILDFIGSGDQLVVTRLDHLAPTSRGVLGVLERLEANNASLYILDPELCSLGEGGRALRAALEAVAAIEPPSPAPRRKPAAAQEIRALQCAGMGPVEIARRLGVSRMTVWRKLKAGGAQPVA